MEKICDFEISSSVKELVKELKLEYKLSEYEALTIALKVEHNELLKQSNDLINCGLGADSGDQPRFLEAIAMALKNLS